MSNFKELMDEEIARGRLNGYCNSWHEAASLIREEFEEFWDEVKKKSCKRDRMNALKELIQIAALCERTAVDLALLEDYERGR